MCCLYFIHVLKTPFTWFTWQYFNLYNILIFKYKKKTNIPSSLIPKPCNANPTLTSIQICVKRLHTIDCFLFLGRFKEFSTSSSFLSPFMSSSLLPPLLSSSSLGISSSESHVLPSFVSILAVSEFFSYSVC